MPDVAFGALPGYGTTNSDYLKLRKCSNVTILENKTNLDDIFSQTRVLLMPSLWSEGFGMAAVDAMLRGIPVLGSDLGGIPEAMLETGFLLPISPIENYQEVLGENLLPIPTIPSQNIAPWVEALRALLSDNALYESHSRVARGKAHRFVEGLSVAPLEKHLKELEAVSGVPGHDNPGLGSRRWDDTEDTLFESLSRLSAEQLALLNFKLRDRKAIR
jgi:glycosyltransferase involved in cell wall biosynthesis